MQSSKEKNESFSIPRWYEITKELESRKKCYILNKTPDNKVSKTSYFFNTKIFILIAAFLLFLYKIIDAIRLKKRIAKEKKKKKQQAEKKK